MAYERTADSTKADANTKLLADSLDAAVSTALSTYQAQVQKSDAADEANFQQLVLQGNMSLADQLAYRTQQLARTPDADSRATIKQDISSLDDQISQKTFADAYTQKLQSNAAGLSSLSDTISWLQSQLAGATDQTVIDKINAELITQQTNQFNAVQKTLQDQTDYAKQDGTSTVINAQITRLSSAKSQALLGGDQETAANLDLQIQGLQQQLAVSQIQTTMNNLAVSTVTSSSSATSLLNAYGSQIASADTTIPITVNGTTYANAQQFWTYTRDSYVADQSGSGFFGRLQQESTDAINVKASNNTLSATDLSSINAQFKSLATNPVLAPFAAQLQTAQQSVLQTAGDALSTVIEDKFDQSLDLNTALNSLQQISAQGVNVDKTTQSILNSAAQTQSQAVSSIMTAAQNLIALNPGMSITDAVAKAVATGAGAIVSNNDFLKNTPDATATDQLTKDTNGTATGPTSTTINGPSATATSTTSGSSTNYVIKAGDTLSAIAAANHTTVQALASANGISDPNLIHAGAVLKIPGTTPTVTTPSATVTQPTTGSNIAPTTSPKIIAPSAALTQPASQSQNKPVDYTLHAGETIQAYNARIASQRSSQSPTSTPTITPQATPASPIPSATSPSATNNTYTIKYGDTLSAIAAQHGTTVDALAKLNNISNPNLISTGATLKLY